MCRVLFSELGTGLYTKHRLCSSIVDEEREQKCTKAIRDKVMEETFPELKSLKVKDIQC